MKYLTVQMGLGGLLRAQMSQGTSIKTTGQEVSKVLSTRTVRPSPLEALISLWQADWLAGLFLFKPCLVPTEFKAMGI